jgi:2-amino-4-hydroxy-6-hydroxymethyldihydropteridine diphosphokinase
VPRILIAFGSNLGDRLGFMQSAIDELQKKVRWERASRVYETAPMYIEDQPRFLNAAAIGQTDLGPFALLDFLKETEATIGRSPAGRNAPRVIDLDLVAYGNLQIHSSRRERTLILPHPRTPERRFVLAPLADIAPDMNLPGLGRIDELLEATNSQAADVKILNDAVLSVCRHGPPG